MGLCLYILFKSTITQQTCAVTSDYLLIFVDSTVQVIFKMLLRVTNALVSIRFNQTLGIEGVVSTVGCGILLAHFPTVECVSLY